jgi:RNA polymerase sigma-70 factor (ECF subfamily)
VDELTDLAFRARAGDRVALGELVRRSQADVWRLCAHLVDPAAADDLTQECFERAIGALGRFEGRAPVRTWLLAIARRTCMDELRRRTRRRNLLARVTAEHRVAPTGGDPTAEDPARGVALDELVAGLDDDRRQAFVLTQVLGLPYAEAAAVCDCPVGTIRSRVARARADLAEAVEPRAARPDRRGPPVEPIAGDAAGGR